MRVGSGRKPKARSGNVVAFDGGAVASSGEMVSAVPPQDLPEAQRDFWKRYAARAIEARTLTPRTIPAFRLLCELENEKRETKETIERDGRTYLKCFVDSSGQEHQELKAHPLTGSYRQLAQRVEALLARFSLAPFGKPTDGAAAGRKPAANPWARVAGNS
jgi:hypothetical protein